MEKYLNSWVPGLSSATGLPHLSGTGDPTALSWWAAAEQPALLSFSTV